MNVLFISVAVLAVIVAVLVAAGRRRAVDKHADLAEKERVCRLAARLASYCGTYRPEPLGDDPVAEGRRILVEIAGVPGHGANFIRGLAVDFVAQGAFPSEPAVDSYDFVVRAQAIGDVCRSLS